MAVFCYTEPMSRLRSVYIGLVILLLPVLCQAGNANPNPAPRTLAVDTGYSFDFNTIARGIMNFLATMITSVAALVFLIGAFMFVLSRGKEDWISRGKEMMFGAIAGMAVVLCSYGILRTMYFFLFGA